MNEPEGVEPPQEEQTAMSQGKLKYSRPQRHPVPILQSVTSERKKTRRVPPIRNVRLMGA